MALLLEHHCRFVHSSKLDPEHLDMASSTAAEETGRKLKVYAVEKNPNVVVLLHDRA